MNNTQLMYKPGDWVQYNFCGGKSYARLNSYKWYVPRPWTDNNDVTHYSDPKIVYNATKIYGLNQGYPSVSNKWSREGWEPLSGYNLEASKNYPDSYQGFANNWPDGMQPKVVRRTHTFLPVWQEDIIGKIDFDSLLIPRYPTDPNGWKVGNIMAWLDTNKLEAMCCPELSKDPDRAKHQWFIERFEQRKAEVLTRKLEL
jgi:hypothetical protein